MSQYPSPYYPPTVQPPYAPYSGSGDVLAPARRASIVMFIVGGLFAMLGMCETLQALVAPMDEVLQRARQMQGDQGGAQAIPLNSEQLKVFLLVVAALFVMTGIAFILLAVGVRRGGKATTVMAMVLTSIVLAGVALVTLLMLVASLQAPMALGFVCVMLIPIGLMVPLVIWLIGALRALPHLANAQQQYIAQYWQYQQNMQAYAGGYGYAGQTQSEGPALPGVDVTPPPSPADGSGNHE